MKKVLIVLILLLLFAGCKPADKEKAELTESNTILSATSDITLEVKEDSITSTDLVLLITNETSEASAYDQEYRLEVKKDNQWYRVNIEMGFPSIATLLKEGPGRTQEFHVHFPEKMERGNVYRIVKGIGKYTLAAEFVYDVAQTETDAEHSDTGPSNSAVSGVYQYTPKTKEEKFIPEQDFLSGSLEIRSSSSKPSQRNN